MQGDNAETQQNSQRSFPMGFGVDKAMQNPAVVNSPWFKKAYDNALEFYEKDKVLDPKDRLELSKTYLSVARAQLWSGWGAFAIVTGIPFVNQYMKTGAIKGTKVTRAFALGFLSMFIGTQAGGSLAYKSKLKAAKPDILEDDPHLPKSSRQKQYEILKLLNMGMPTRWANYYYMTYKNPERRIPDPRLVMDKLKEGNSGVRNSSVLFDNKDPMGLYTGPQYDKKEGVPKTGVSQTTPPSQVTPRDDYDPFNDTETQEPTLSSWDKIRKENTAVDTKNGKSWEEIRKHDYDNSDTNYK
ncbi:Rci37p [Kluyveromyces lactis]|uniref:KLLA0F05940p n=1 Tax=Kluyveromyces lactis (strain ATCC 8585 / CBS 2359 / DSM 70799 / NBRC 1267 / NRRL Y-1140 / WM37) TaxID=284590 RepID=Q6CL40_KLULA|nr:uncharacterized protein KLLA0_F05940g [Kluyveromyces lactis]CAG98057.1 KLLA0F05940p [Kluyveromyces lactis]|eukprot:XP_455349.1 uncharacterized protein KLLA0_F05940g [Kluyveromyces lactis]